MNRRKLFSLQRGIVLAATVVAAGLGCSDTTGPGGGRPPADLNILRLAQGAPPLYQDTVSFWARYDQETEGQIYFQDSQGGPGEKFLEFKVPRFALQQLGTTTFGPGDSLLISIKVVNPDSLLFQFQPQGLKFNALQPAELSLEYNHAGGHGGEGDYNDDGVVNAADTTIEGEISLWHQPVLGAAFVKIGTLVIEDLDEIEAEIPGFSRYALAY